MRQQLHDLGAKTTLGFALDFDKIGSKKMSLVMAFAKGTAVVIARSE